MVYGQGIYDGDIVVRPTGGVMHPAYMKWMAMLGRCYCPVQQKRDPSYEGVTVCEEWKLFSNFYAWLQTWDNWDNLELDKDIIGGRVYSPSTCLMISPELNKFLSYQKKQGKLAGCYYEKSREKYKANINIDGKVKTLGRFETELDAHLCWLRAKTLKLQEFFNTESERVVPHLKTMGLNMLQHVIDREPWTH
jgi:hypothetical protein